MVRTVPYKLVPSGVPVLCPCRLWAWERVSLGAEITGLPWAMPSGSRGALMGSLPAGPWVWSSLASEVKVRV